MDYQVLFNVAGSLAAFMGGWWMKVLHDSVKELQAMDKELASKVNNIEILVAGSYVKKDEFNNLANALFAKLDRIEDKLDRKVDKGQHA